MVNINRERLERRYVVSKILSQRENTLVVSGLGSPTYDVHASGDDDRNFYLWGGMGGAAMIGLGLAISQPEKKIIVITGDGEQLMGIGSIATISVQKPKNLMIVVLDNEHFGETGMQTSHTFQGVDLVGISIAAGCPNAIFIEDNNDFEKFLEIKKELSSFTFVVIKIAAPTAPRSLPIVDGNQIKNRFRSSIGLK